MSKSFFQKIFGSPTSSTSPSATSAAAPVQNLTPAQKEQLRLQEERQREQQKRQVVNNMIRNTATAVMSANGFKTCIVRTTDTTFTMDVQIPGSCSSYGRNETLAHFVSLMTDGSYPLGCAFIAMNTPDVYSQMMTFVNSL